MKMISVHNIAQIYLLLPIHIDNYKIILHAYTQHYKTSLVTNRRLDVNLLIPFYL